MSLEIMIPYFRFLLDSIHNIRPEYCVCSKDKTNKNHERAQYLYMY